MAERLQGALVGFLLCVVVTSGALLTYNRFWHPGTTQTSAVRPSPGAKDHAEGVSCTTANGKALVLAERHQNDLAEEQLDFDRLPPGSDYQSFVAQRGDEMLRKTGDTINDMINVFRNDCDSGGIIMVPAGWGQ